MIFEIYISRLIIYCILALVLGVIVAFFTVTSDNKEMDIFSVFKNIGLAKLFEMIWLPIVKLFGLIGIDLEILAPKKK